MRAPTLPYVRVIVLSPSRWSGPRLSKHFVAGALADDGHDVLYVDPPLSLGSLLRQPSRRHDALAAADELARPGLRVWRPRVAPGQSSGIGQRVNRHLLERGLARRQPDPDLVLAFGVEARGVLPHLGGRRVYWCTDSIEDLPGADRARIAAREQAMVDAADLVVACSPPLADQLRARGADVLYVPHACDPDSLVALPAPPELRDVSRPLVGYVGSINFRVDVDLLEAARRATPGTLVIVGAGLGPSEDSATAAFLRRPDVLTVGHRPASELPAWLHALDVAVVPYGAHPFNRKSFPIKILQHLAAGTPVVSTENGATDELGDLVRVASDAGGFGAAVGEAWGAASDVAARERRRNAAVERTWPAAVAQVLLELGIKG